MSLQGWLTLSYVVIAAGLVISALGGFGRFYFRHQIDITPPEIEVKSLIPIMIYEKKEQTFDAETKIPFMNKGLSIVLHVKSGSKPITISRLKIKGKIFVSVNFYMCLDENVGRTAIEIGQDWKKRKPYVRVDWTAYVDETKSDKTLEAFDDKLICFNLIDVILEGQAEGGWEDSMSDYLGYSDGTKEPTEIRTYPEFNHFFKTKHGEDFPFAIRDEIKNGDIQFILVAGSREIVIPYKYFKKSQFFNKDNWGESQIEKIIFRDK